MSTVQSGPPPIPPPTPQNRFFAAGQLAAKQAHRAKMTSMDLPAAYRALGRHLYGHKLFTDDFSEIYKEFETLAAELKAIKSHKDQPVADGLAAKAKAAAGGVKDAALQKSTEYKTNQAFAKLGEMAFVRHGINSGPEELVKPISAIRYQIQTFDTEIATLSASKPGQLITPKRIVIAACIFFGIMILGAIGSLNEKDKTENSAATPSSDRKKEMADTVSQSTSSKSLEGVPVAVATPHDGLTDFVGTWDEDNGSELVLGDSGTAKLISNSSATLSLSYAIQASGWAKGQVIAISGLRRYGGRILEVK